MRTMRSSLVPIGRAIVTVVLLVVLGGCGGVSGGSGGSGSAGVPSGSSADEEEPGGCDLSDLVGGEEAEARSGQEGTTEEPNPVSDTQPCLETPPATGD